MTSDLHDIPALILAGGLGTRLQSAIGNLPKVLAPVAGKPLICHQLDRLAAAGVRQVILCTGYRAELVEHTLGAKYGELALRYSREWGQLGTGGAIRLAASLVASPLTIVLNGDSLCHANLAELVAQHQAAGAKATLLVTDVKDASRFGRVEMDATFGPLTGWVQRFAEKGASGPGLVNAGVYVLSSAAMSEIPALRAVSLERETFPGWIGQGLLAHAGASRLIDIGTPESYAAAEAWLRIGAGE